jgi:hypothetical protein
MPTRRVNQIKSTTGRAVYTRAVKNRAPVRHAAAWLALVAMLAFALAPTLSRAMASAGAGGWTEVCTAQGMKWVPVDAGADGRQAPAASLEACKLCSLAADGAAPLPVQAQVSVSPVLAGELPPAFLHVTCTPHTWRTAQPRAPPALSA